MLSSNDNKVDECRTSLSLGSFKSFEDRVVCRQKPVVSFVERPYHTNAAAAAMLAVTAMATELAPSIFPSTNHGGPRLQIIHGPPSGDSEPHSEHWPAHPVAPGGTQ